MNSAKCISKVGFVILSVLFFHQPAWAESTLTNELFGYWPFTGNANDESGYGHHGVVHGASLTTDRFGNSNQAYLFNGSSDYIEVESSEDWIFTNMDFTVCTWLKFDYVPSLNMEQTMMVGHSEGSNMSNKWFTGYSVYHPDERYGGFAFHVNDTTNCDYIAYYPCVPSTNQWYHLVAIISSNTYKIYLNGDFASQEVWAHVIPKIDAPLTIGMAESIYFEGILDDIRIYRRALTSNEISTLYANIAAPTGVSATDGTYTDKVRVTWDSVSGATGYQVWRNTANSSASASSIGAATDVTYDDTSATADVTYYYWVKATNSTATSEFSDSDAGYRISEASLTAPTNVYATDGAYTNKVLITWNWASGATSYEVWRNTTNDTSSASKLADATETSCDDTSASIGQTYYYWVKAKNSSITSAFSDSDSGHVAAPDTVLAAPTGVSASDGTCTGEIAVTWTAVSEATSYEVWRAVTNSSSAAISLVETNGTSYDDTNVLAGISYYYWVKAKNSESTSEFSLSDTGYASIEESSGTADLALSNFILLPTAMSPGEHPSVLAFLLINYGPDSLGVLNTRVQYDFYLSSNATFGDSDDVWVGDCGADQTLSAGNYTTVMLSETDREGVAIPSGLSGDYYVFVKVRHASPSTLSDSDESNNYAMRSGTIAISSSGTNAGYHACHDFDGDGVSDLTLYHEATGYWYILQTTDGLMNMQFGGAGYRPVLGDYDGDGKSDLTVYDTASGYWFMFLTASITIDYQQVGGEGYEPVCGDFDGDGKSDLAVYHTSSGYWYVLFSASAELSSLQFGASGYEPIHGDFDGDGKSDLAVYHTSSGYWYILLSGSDYSISYMKFGACGYRPVPGDYDGDGKTDMAVYQQSTGYWYIFYSGNTSLDYMKFGEPGYEPVGGDYDGDGRRDLAVYNEATGYWFFMLSSSGELTYMKFGETGYEPVDCDYDLDDDAGTISGKINVNPNNSSDSEFMLTKTDGSTITRDDLTQDFAGYSGCASRVYVKPKGNGNQNDLIVDGQVYTLSNSKTYDIESDSMTVNLYNDNVNSQGKAVGQWWISITATVATITVTD
ncbi:LamG-like jellyroll fold domain-containing protein [Verrucomicrobiota bacterium]